MKYIILFIIVSFGVNAGTLTANKTCSLRNIKKNILKLKWMKKSRLNKLAKSIRKAGKYHNLNCNLLITHFKVESNFRQSAINKYTGEIAIGQINHPLWSKMYKTMNREFCRYKKITKSKYYKNKYRKYCSKYKKLNYNLLKNNMNYAIDNTAYILNYLRMKHSKRDKIWFARYNSGNYLYKLEYLNYLEYQFKKLGIADSIVDYTAKSKMIKSSVRKYGWKRILSIYTRLENKEKRIKNYEKRFKNRPKIQLKKMKNVNIVNN